MAESIDKILPQNLYDNKEYLVRARAVNAFGNASEWSDSLYIDTSRSINEEGFIQSTKNNFSVRNNDGEIVFGAFTVKEQRNNLIKNPSFEVSMVGWESIGSTTLALSDSGDSFAGLISAKLTVAAATKQEVGFRQAATDYTAVTAGQVYTASAHIFRSYLASNHSVPSEESKFDIKLNYYNSSGTLISTNLASQPMSTSHSIWSRISLKNVIIPVGVFYIGVEVSYSDTNTLDLDESEFFLVDGVLLEELPTLNMYFDGSLISGVTSWDGADHLSTSLFDNINQNTVYVKGNVTADTGAIGPLTIAPTKVYLGTGTYNNTNTPFYVDESGQFSLKDKLTWDGTALAITGSVTATEGAIGPLTIAPTKAYLGTGTYNNTDTPFYIDDTGQFSLKDKLTWDGTSLSISGTVTATEGIIGPLTIAPTKIHLGTGTYSNTNTAFYIDDAGQFSLKDKLTWNGTSLQVKGGISAEVFSMVNTLNQVVAQFDRNITAYSLGTHELALGGVASSAANSGLFWGNSSLGLAVRDTTAGYGDIGSYLLVSGDSSYPSIGMYVDALSGSTNKGSYIRVGNGGYGDSTINLVTSHDRISLSSGADITLYSSSSTLLSASGADRINVGSTIYMYTTLDMGNNNIQNTDEIRASSGTAVDPAYTFVNDSNTGMYSYGADQLGFSTGSGNRAILKGDGFYLASGDWFRVQGNTGWYNSTYTAGMNCSGDDWVRDYSSTGIIASKILVTSPNTTTTFSGYNDALYGLYNELYKYTSTRENKANVQSLSATFDSGDLIDRLRPVHFVAKPDPQDYSDVAKWKEADVEIGFIAEEVALLANGWLASFEHTDDPEYEIGMKPSAWRHRSMVTIAIEELRLLRARVTTLEQEVVRIESLEERMNAAGI
jgi:hypothetical protein